MEKKSSNGTSNLSTLPKVHSSPKPSSNISFQSILQPVPKLYKYSADQLQVVIHRRSGEVEHISRKDVLPGPRPAQVVPSRLKYKDDLESSKLRLKDEIKDTGLGDALEFSAVAAGEPVTATASATETVEKPPLPCIPDDEIISPIQATPDQATRPSSHASWVAGECSSCETLLINLGELEAEVLRLRGLLESKDVQLKKARHRLEVVTNQYIKLKSSASGIRNGMNSLAKIIKSSNADSEVNDKRIMELLQRAWPDESIVKPPTLFKSIDSSLDKMRDHVNRLSIIPQFGMGSPTPSPMSLLNNKTDSLLSFNVNLINGKCGSEA